MGVLTDRADLTAGLLDGLAVLTQRRRSHDRGLVLTHLAVAIANGATTLNDAAVLRHQPYRFGRVASAPTVWRTVTALTGETRPRIAAARAGRDAATVIPAGAACGRWAGTHSSLSSPSMARW